MVSIEKIYEEMIEYLSDEKLWMSIGLGLLKIILILVGSFIVIKIGKALIANVFQIRHKNLVLISERREATLVKLLNNVLVYAVYFIVIVMILSVLNVDVKALIAGAGIVGLAVGFGAQNLVRDIITGFFIIFEDQFSVGDYVRIGTSEGTVEEIGLRTSKIKSWTGELHIIPNGNIAEVTNFSLNNSVAVVDISIAYNEDIAKAEKAITELISSIGTKYENMIKPPELLGIQQMGTSDLMIRVICETKPMCHFSVARNLRKELKNCLDAHGLEVPYPRMVLYNRENDGNKLG